MKEKCLQEVIYTLYLRPLFLHSRIATLLAFYSLIPSGKLKGFLLFFRKYHVIILKSKGREAR